MVLLFLLCVFSGCASKKTTYIAASETEKINEVETDKSKTDIIETIKKETIVQGDTIEGKVKVDEIKKKPVVFENEHQKITISYDDKSDSVIFNGVQKAKKQIEEIRREIKQQNDKETKREASRKSEVKATESEPVPDTSWSGWTWFKIGIATALSIGLIWRFRKFIPYINRL